MKMRIYSWILPSAYLVWGVFLFFDVARFQEELSGFTSLPFLKGATLAVGPYGWLFTAVVVSTILILNDLRFHLRFVNIIFTIILPLWVYCMAGIFFVNGTYQIH
jgi:hypothetical protein